MTHDLTWLVDAAIVGGFAGLIALLFGKETLANRIGWLTLVGWVVIFVAVRAQERTHPTPSDSGALSVSRATST